MVKQTELPRNPKNPTSFLTIYDAFFSRITDDMYMELTEEDTYGILQDLLITSLPRFEFPRVDIFDYEIGSWGYLGEYEGVESNNKEVTAYGWIGGNFNVELTLEEMETAEGGNPVSGTYGRLLWYSEASSLASSYSTMIYGPSNARLCYWLGTSGTIGGYANCVWWAKGGSTCFDYSNLWNTKSYRSTVFVQ